MQKIALFIFITILISFTVKAQHRIIAECTITYKIASADTASMQKSLRSSSKTVYIKGNESRTDLISSSFNQTIFYDKTNGQATILREFGNNKFITTLDNKKWIDENKRFEGLTVETIEEHKKIIGYDCKKAVLHLLDGSTYTLFYAPSIIPSVKEFEYQFKDVPGLVLSYETSGDKADKVVYTASKINLSPIPGNLFIIPNSGYWVL